jgi:hypothetical protein
MPRNGTSRHFESATQEHVGTFCGHQGAWYVLAGVMQAHRSAANSNGGAPVAPNEVAGNVVGALVDDGSANGPPFGAIAAHSSAGRPLPSANKADGRASVASESAFVHLRGAAFEEGSARSLVAQANQAPARVSDLQESANDLLGSAIVLLKRPFHRHGGAFDGAFAAVAAR